MCTPAAAASAAALRTRLISETGTYAGVSAGWPSAGQHILAHVTTDESEDGSGEQYVVVYQAFNERIARHAAEHQTFKGAPGYNERRMTWVKTNFLWMMFRCEWATWSKDENQARVLALRLRRSYFDLILQASASVRAKGVTSDVLLQWDPDHSPFPPFTKHPQRRAVQLGLRGAAAAAFVANVVAIEDVTDLLVIPQHSVVFGDSADESRRDKLLIPVERLYVPADPALCAHIGLDAPPAGAAVW